MQFQDIIPSGVFMNFWLLHLPDLIVFEIEIVMISKGKFWMLLSGLMLLHAPSNYSQGQKHVIKLKNFQELFSPNMSSQVQLDNSPELIFISTGRCQLDDFREILLEFCFGGSLPLRSLRNKCFMSHNQRFPLEM